MKNRGRFLIPSNNEEQKNSPYIYDTKIFLSQIQLVILVWSYIKLGFEQRFSSSIYLRKTSS